MFSFIPTEFYTTLFYLITLILVVSLLVVLHYKDQVPKTKSSKLLLVFGLIFYIGFRPFSSQFVDMSAYGLLFDSYAIGLNGQFKQDPGFDWLIKNLSIWSDKSTFFFIIAFIYVYAHYWSSKKFFNEYWYYSFLIFIASFSFWSYGVNGIRNGVAAAVLLLAFSFERQKWIAITLAIISVSFHKSMLLPVAAYFVTFIFNNSKYYLLVWLVCIPLSLITEGDFELYFASLGLEDQRLSYLTEGNINDDNFSSTGFRWDFLVYSATAIAVGFYFVIKRQFKDVLYQRLLNVYLMSNAFWILVIRANFSNRFAYLSWFMMGLIIIYPFLKENSMKKHPRIVGWVLFIYFSFTFIMNVIIAKE